MLLTDLLETLMIVCFGLSWPISIWKSWKSRTAQGKSLIFEVFIEQAACSGSTWGSDFFRGCQSVHRSITLYSGGFLGVGQIITQNQNMAALIITASDEVLPAIQKMTNRSATYWGAFGIIPKATVR